MILNLLKKSVFYILFLTFPLERRTMTNDRIFIHLLGRGRKAFLLNASYQTARYKSLHECAIRTKRFNISRSRGTINASNASTCFMWQNTCFKWVGTGNPVGIWKITRGYGWNRSIKMRTHWNNMIQWNRFWQKKKSELLYVSDNIFNSL